MNELTSKPTSDGLPAYRVGRSVGRTIYRRDTIIGIMDTRADAELIVELLNANDVNDLLFAVQPNNKENGQ